MYQSKNLRDFLHYQNKIEHIYSIWVESFDGKSTDFLFLELSCLQLDFDEYLNKFQPFLPSTHLNIYTHISVNRKFIFNGENSSTWTHMMYFLLHRLINMTFYFLPEINVVKIRKILENTKIKRIWWKQIEQIRVVSF